MAANAAELIELLFSILLPPIGVFLRRGCGVDLVINILLTFLGYFPGKLGCIDTIFSLSTYVG